MPSISTELTNAYHVRGQCQVITDGRTRTVTISRIISADSATDAERRALQQIGRQYPPDSTAKWNDVQATWIARQYQWTFEDAAPLTKEAPVPEETV